MKETTDFAALMPQVAELVLGEFIGPKNRHMSTSTEWRWGSNGSVSVDLTKGVWSDHEDDTGGGVLDMLKSFKGLDGREAIDWLIERGLMKPRERDGEERSKPSGKFAGFMDDWPIATYEYFDDRGRLAYEVLKFEKTAPRRYMQRRPHPSGKGWVWGLRAGDYGMTRSGDWFKVKEGKKYEAVETFEDARWFLYRRDEVVKAVAEGRPVVLVEGEKDVETLRAWGFVATTNQGGAKNWHADLNADLAAADIVICSDIDKAGNARNVLRGADLRTVAKRVRILDLALHWPAAPEKSDVTDWKEKAGGTDAKFLPMVANAPLWRPEQPRSRYGAFTWHQMDAPGLEYEYIIESFLTERGRSVLGGPSGSGKSFLAIHMAMCIARGQDFFQYPVKRGGVIYQAGEGGHGIKKRFKAYRKHYQVPDTEDIPLVILPAKVDLFAKEGDTKALIEEIKAWSVTMTEPLRCIFIDTLATATIGADENSGKDMSVVLANIALIEQECGAHVCLVHHMNADGKKLRGHTSIHANVDQVILVTNDEETRTRTVKLVKQKDDEDGLTIKFKLMSVPVAFNQKTEREITSCVVLSVTEAEMLKQKQEQLGFSPNPTERRILMNMFDAMERYGKFVADEKDGPIAAKGRIVVDYRYFRDVALEKMPEEERQKAIERIKKEFARTKDTLIKYGIIGVVNPVMWWNGKPIRGFSKTFPRANEASALPAETTSPGVRELFDDPSLEDFQL